MTQNTQNPWAGAKWWKVDFHTHTPASDDYGKGPDQASLKNRTHREWLVDFMQAEIDCVAITDHNSGAWIDGLKSELQTMRSENADDFRELVLFPGVEISVNGGIHLLALLDPSKTSSDIDSLLGAVGYSGEKGKSDEVTSKSFSEVIDLIQQAQGIAIPAHADATSGLFKLEGTTLIQAISNKNLFAMELIDPTFVKPQVYTSEKLSWTEVLGSDAHHPSGNPGTKFAGSHFTWVKMGIPNLEGLRLALLDGGVSVRRSDVETGDPNNHAALFLHSIEIREARYMGRAGPFALDLSPWLSTIIGGRGTGKSSLVEFIRVALQRTDELPDELKSEFVKYQSVYQNREENGLLTDNAEISIVYIKDGTAFRIQWKRADGEASIHEKSNNTWIPTDGDIRQRFPIRIYSQKQIYNLANKPSALLGIVDEAPEVDFHSWEERWKEEESHYLSLRAKIREIETGLSEETRIKGELEDITRRLKVFEDAGHTDVLKTYQSRSRQNSSIESWEESWSEIGDTIRKTASALIPDDIDAALFDSESTSDKQIQELANTTKNELTEIEKALIGLATQADGIRTNWGKAKDSSEWKATLDTANTNYQELKSKLEEEGAGDPNAYGQLVTRRQEIEKRLSSFEQRKTQLIDLKQKTQSSYEKLLSLRREITALRNAFLGTVLSGNNYVKISVSAYGDRDGVEIDFRELVQRSDGGFEKDIGGIGGKGILGDLYEDDESEKIEEKILKIKKTIRSIARSDHDPDAIVDQRFASHISKLQPEVIDRVDTWFPADTLDVRYSPTGDGKSFRSIKEGSPGQKTAALLAFLLSYGQEPLVLDQPEDDLDNQLIYDLIVAQLREVKRQRQILVVTHNANIVVNGDSELVVALSVQSGETKQECTGSLQEQNIRDSICDVMEGGREAFEQRYRRIALGGRYQ